MNVRRSLLGLGAALLLGAASIAPVMAATEVGSVPVSVTVQDNGGTLTVGIASSSDGNFGTVPVDAAESATGGVKNAGTKTLTLEIKNDTKLFNTNGFDITIRLKDGYLAPNAQPTFEASSSANFQIPGRYLKITAVGNPQQAKYTGTSSCANPWDGSGTTAASQCVPRDAAGAKPIYKVSDPVGLMGQADYLSGDCRVTSGSTPLPWKATCPDNSFSNTSGKLITHFRAGSGTVETTQQIEISLDVPAGVYPGEYTGTLIIEQVIL